MRDDVAALRAHLVAEAHRARKGARSAQRRAANLYKSAVDAACADYADGGVWASTRQWWSHDGAKTAREATDAWLAADARLRALDGLLAASKAQADALELRRTGTFARGRWYTREEIDALMLAPCEGDACAWRECLPCGLRRLGAAARPWHEHRSWPPTRAT